MFIIARCVILKTPLPCDFLLADPELRSGTRCVREWMQRPWSNATATRKVNASLNVLRKFVRFVDALNERVGTVVSWCTTLLVVTVCLDVFTRYFLRSSSVAVQELEWHFFAVIFLLASAWALKHNKHVRVDVLYMNFKPRNQALANLIGSLLFLLPFAVIVIWSSQNFVMNSFRIGEVSPDPGGLPARYILKSMIPIGFSLILLQGLAMAVRSFDQFMHYGEDPLGDAEEITPERPDSAREDAV